MIEVVQFKREHMNHLVEPRPGVADRIEKIAEIPRAFVATLMTDKPVAVIGGHEVYPGVYEVWSVLGDVSPVRFSVIREIRRALNKQALVLEIRRYQMYVAYNNQHCRFAYALGFSAEGILKHFDANGNDYFIYGRVN